MSEDLHHIDRLFKKAIDGEEEQPPPNLWEKIDSQLEKEASDAVRKKYYSWQRVAAVFLTIAVGIGMYALQIVHQNRQASTINKKDTPATAHTHNFPGHRKRADEKQVFTNPNAIQNNDENPLAPNISAYNKSGDPTIVKDNKVTSKLVNDKANSYPPIQGPIYNSEVVDKESTVLSNKGNKTRDTHYLPTIAAIEMDKTRLPNSKPAIDQDRSLPTPTLLPLLTNTIDNDRLAPLATIHPLSPGPIVILNTPIHHITTKKTVSVSVFFSPEQNSTRLSNPAMAVPRERLRDEFKQKEQYSTSYKAGILSAYTFTTNWSLQSGVTYTRYSIEIAPKIIYAQRADQGKIMYRYNCSSGYSFIEPQQGTLPAVGDSIEAPHAKSTYAYVGIPLQINYTFRKGKVAVVPSVGISANFLTKGEMKTSISGAVQNSKVTSLPVNGLRKTYISGITSVGVAYRLGAKVSIGVAPTIHVALTSINKEALVQSYPTAFGVASGIKFTF